MAGGVRDKPAPTAFHYLGITFFRNQKKADSCIESNANLKAEHHLPWAA